MKVITQHFLHNTKLMPINMKTIRCNIMNEYHEAFASIGLINSLVRIHTGTYFEDTVQIWEQKVEHLTGSMEIANSSSRLGQFICRSISRPVPSSASHVPVAFQPSFEVNCNLLTLIKIIAMLFTEFLLSWKTFKGQVRAKSCFAVDFVTNSNPFWQTPLNM